MKPPVMKIGLIDWVSSCLIPTKNMKIERYCAVILLSWVNRSLAVTHDPRDPSKNGDPFDPFPSLVDTLMFQILKNALLDCFVVANPCQSKMDYCDLCDPAKSVKTPCHEDADCDFTNNVMTCTCHAGYTGDGHTCAGYRWQHTCNPTSPFPIT